MSAEGQAGADDRELIKSLRDRYPGAWVALNQLNVVIDSAKNAAKLIESLGTPQYELDRDGIRLVYVEAPTEPPSVDAIATVIARAMLEHYPTRGMKVSMDQTCECRYWTGTEDPRQDSIRGPGLGGRDQLNWHRAQVAAQALIEAGLVR